MDTSSLNRFAGVPSPEKMITVIEDKLVRETITKSCLKIEDALKKGIGIDYKFHTEVPWGLNIDISMSQPKPDKPIIFRFTYSINLERLYTWCNANIYLFDGPVVSFASKGVQVIMPKPERYHKTYLRFMVRYHSESDGEPIDWTSADASDSFTFVAHRDLIDTNYWFVGGELDQ